MIKRLSDNPFRLLGVYANSSARDIIANKGKMSAFIKVGRQITFPLDLTPILGELNRTTENVTAADSLLTMENDKLLAAQFWFIKSNQFDDVAFNHLFSGNIDAAISIWDKKECMSSLQNKAICYLLQDNIRQATLCLSVMYERFKADFLTAIDIHRDISMEELVSGYVSTILESKPNINFSLLANPECSNTWNKIAKGKTVEPLIKQLNDAIAKAKQSKGKSPRERLNAGKTLKKEATSLIKKLKALVSDNDIQFINISDKVANEILQCGIDFYNDSDSPFVVHEALNLQESASAFAMGTMTKQRIKENVEILRKNVQDLPPQEIEHEHQIIQQALIEYCKQPDEISYAVTLINKTRPALNIIRQKLGADHEYYIKRSSLVVGNVLHNLIEEVNARQKEFNEASAGSYSEKQAFEKYKTAVEDAWNLFTTMNGFAMDEATAKRVNENKATLRNLRNQVNSSGGSSSSSDDDNSWGSCLIQLLIYAGIGLLIRACGG